MDLLQYTLITLISTGSLLFPTSTPSIQNLSGSACEPPAIVETGSLTEKTSPPKATESKAHFSTRYTPRIRDWSREKYVARSISLDDQKYAPSDLISIEHEHIGTAGRKNLTLRREATEALWSMADDFSQEFGTPLVVISGYRSYDYQQWMWDLGKCTDSLCAPPGHSEHQLGLAVDLFDASTKEEYMSNPTYASYVRWLQENAPKYGFTQSYQKGVEIDEYEIEPWHWRYIGVEMATKLQRLGWTYAEYYHFQESMKWLR